MKFIYKLVLISILCGLCFSCSQKEDATQNREALLEEHLEKVPFKADMILPPHSTEKNIELAVPVRTVLRKDADSLLAANAPDYKNSLLIGLVRTAYYVNNQYVNVEIAQFASTDDAFGFYSLKRPDGITLSQLGSESYFRNNALHYTKGEYAVSITAGDNNNEPENSIMKMAVEIDSRIPVTPRKPQFFILFPMRGQIVPSKKYYSRSYLGIEGIDSIYTITYQADEDTLKLFLTMDTAGTKFIEFSTWAKTFGKTKPAPREFDFESGHSVSFEHPLHGQIVAGLIRKKLAGVIDYKRGSSLRLCSRWIKGLQ